MSHHSDVLIVGGGVIGLTTAYFLAKEGLRIRVVERGALGAEASWAGAGIIPPGNPDSAANGYDRLRAQSSAMFQQFSAELQERTGIDNGYRICGGIEFLDDEGTVAAWRAERVPFEKVDSAWLLNNEPNLLPRNTAAYCLPGMAQIRNPWHLRALIAACRDIGVELTADTSLAKWETKGNSITGAALETGSTLHADRYLIAAGAWSESLLTPFGIRTGIHPVRGQIVLVKTVPPLLRRIVFVGRDYLVPREDGCLLIGSTEEPEAGFRKQTTAEAVAHLIGFATSLTPGVRQAEMVKAWAGLRPGSRDGLPSIGRVGDCSNLFLAGGHFRAGIQLSPATAQVVCDLMLNRQPGIDISPFQPGRVPRPAFSPAFRS